MRVTVGNDFSGDLQVNGDCPQGSVLGVFLFNVCSNELENEGEAVGILDNTEVDLEIGVFFDQADE